MEEELPKGIPQCAACGLPMHDDPPLTFAEQVAMELLAIERTRLEIQLAKVRTEEGRMSGLLTAVPLLTELFSKLGKGVSFETIPPPPPAPSEAPSETPVSPDVPLS